MRIVWRVYVVVGYFIRLWPAAISRGQTALWMGKRRRQVKERESVWVSEKERVREIERERKDAPRLWQRMSERTRCVLGEPQPFPSRRPARRAFLPFGESTDGRTDWLTDWACGEHNEAAAWSVVGGGGGVAGRDGARKSVAAVLTKNQTRSKGSTDRRGPRR